LKYHPGSKRRHGLTTAILESNLVLFAIVPEVTLPAKWFRAESFESPFQRIVPFRGPYSFSPRYQLTRPFSEACTIFDTEFRKPPKRLRKTTRTLWSRISGLLFFPLGGSASKLLFRGVTSPPFLDAKPHINYPLSFSDPLLFPFPR